VEADLGPARSTTRRRSAGPSGSWCGGGTSASQGAELGADAELRLGWYSVQGWSSSRSRARVMRGGETGRHRSGAWAACGSEIGRMEAGGVGEGGAMAAEGNRREEERVRVTDKRDPHKYITVLVGVMTAPFSHFQPNKKQSHSIHVTKHVA